MLQARDLMKRGLCVENGVELIVITCRELSPGGILRRITGRLPVMPVDRSGPLIQKLLQICANYRASAAELR